MRCPNCGTENQRERRFCAQCGAPVGIQCPTCGFVNEPEANFCGGCGQAVKAPAPSPEPPSACPSTVRHEVAGAEHRQITVMFCDLVGSTELSEKLEAEQLREVIHDFQEACREAIARFDGFIARYMGDGILAYFGYPQAHEQDAERAVRASLRIVEAIAGLNDKIGDDGRREGVALAVRVGIATGPVITGDVVGEGAAEEKTVVGRTPNLAARLQALAEPNTVMTAAATRQLTDGLFAYEDLGRRHVKGFAEPVQVWRVLRAKETETRFEATHMARLTPLVGREEEIEVLLRRWRRARKGEGQVVLLCGENGVGKSRLVQALRERIAADPHIRLRYQCSPYFTGGALYPVVGQLARAARLVPDDTPQRKLDKLEAMLSWGTDEVETAAPLFADLLSIPAGGRYPPRDLGPEQRTERILTALIKQMEGLALRQPLLVVFEDAHWIDPTSLELLDRAIERTPALPILMIVTFRPDFAPPWLGQSHVTLLTLNRMTRRHCMAVAERVAGGKKLPEEIVDQIVAKTDGVPLFIEELTKMVLDSAVLAEETDRYVLARPLPSLAIPTSLRDSLMARLDQMGAVKQIAQIAAAIGHQFTSRLLEAVSPLSGDELRNALKRLVKAGVLVQRGAEPHTVYAFKHTLIQEMAYESLLKSKRRELHRKIARALKDDFPEVAESQPELLAYHVMQAGLAEQELDC